MERVLEEIEAVVENPFIDLEGLKKAILRSGFDPDLKERAIHSDTLEDVKEVLLFQKNRWEKVE